MKPTTAASRLLALDYLRGFFIAVIIIDHLWRWPNIFQYISGRGELWASAAEGFVIISGLLIGYIRGYKNRQQPLGEVSAKLIRRGLLLYIWMVISTTVLVTLTWMFPYKGSLAWVPYNPYDWYALFTGVLRLDYVHSLTHFLYLYAIFLLISPLVIWLFRRSLAWVVGSSSLIIWYVGLVGSIEWMQWQILFFLPAIAGFYLESLRHYYNHLPSITRSALAYGIIAITLISIIISGAMVLPSTPGSITGGFFSREPLALPRILIAFVWFMGLFSLFELCQRYLKRYLGWLLLPFGTRSLTAYILHGLPLMICSFFFAGFSNIWINSLLAVVCILATWALVKIPHINRVIPR